LSELVARAAAGEAVCIMRRGKPVAQLTAIALGRKRVDLSALRAMTDTMPMQSESVRDFVRRMRDGERY
jgi:antitoxin (DNA-binding transcriptional repressor) of toxin-antitoxin stability system